MAQQTREEIEAARAEALDRVSRSFKDVGEEPRSVGDDFGGGDVIGYMLARDLAVMAADPKAPLLTSRDAAERNRALAADQAKAETDRQIKAKLAAAKAAEAAAPAWGLDDDVESYEDSIARMEAEDAMTLEELAQPQPWEEA